MRWSWDNHPEVAEHFGDSLVTHIELLRQFPRLGAPVEGGKGVRRLLHSPLEIYYRVHEAKLRIEILHIRHGARQPPI